MSENLDDILSEIQRNRESWGGKAAESAENALEKAEEERRDKVAAFQLQMNLDDEFGEYTSSEQPAAVESADTLGHTRVIGGMAAPQETAPAPPVRSASPERAAAPTEEKKAPAAAKKRKKTDPKAREVWGCAGSIFYVMFILGISLLLACVIIVAALDLTGLNKSSAEVKVSFDEGATVDQIAAELKENDIIDQKWLFNLYSKLRKVDTEYKPGIYTLSANMGYGNIMDVLCAGMPRTVVRVTIPEGYTIDQIAKLMEDNAVCTKKAFYDAVQNGDYSAYSFIADIPAKEGDYAGRGYTLEGYLFPDTYDFYTGSSGESVVKKLLDNFDTRIDTTYKTKIAAQGMTINDVVILASIVQAEASDGEWSSVSRVLTNRLNNKAEFPSLQCEATINYYKKLDLTVSGLTISQDAYDTAVRKGLTPGAICNPGLHAINAVLAPSEDPEVAGCYYFATDYSTGITYYSKTYSQHVAICKKYNIGLYAADS